MGIVTRQSTWNLALIIVGFAVGGLSKFFVLPELLTKQELGKLDLIVYHAVMLSTILNLGSATTVVKHFKEFETRHKHGALIRNMILLPLVVTLVISVGLLIYPEIYQYFVAVESKNFMVGAIGILIMMTASQNITLTLSGISSSYLKSTFPIFLSEIVLRILLVSGVVLYYYNQLTFSGLVMFYGFSYFSIALLLAISVRSQLISGIFSKIKFDRSEWKSLSEYGVFSLLDSGASKLVTILDILMIGWYLMPEFVGFYTIGMAVSAVVKMSSRAITPIASPIIAKAWAEKDMGNIRDIYSKSSLNQMIIGGLMLIAIWASIDSIEMLLPYEFRHIKFIVFWLGLGNLINVAAGVNGNIILNSSRYKVNFYLNATLLVITFVLNAVLIPIYGIEGAAIATCSSLAIFNVLKFLFILKSWKLQPLTLNHLKAAILIIGFMFLANILPEISEFLLFDIAIKSGAVALLFGLIIYFSKISPDINENLKRISPIKLP